MEVDEEEFEALVAEALDSLPEALGRQVDNVHLVVRDQPTRGQLEGGSGTLLGLYEGIPLTARSPTSYSGVMPDRITIFRLPICRLARTRDELVALVRTTVIHEYAHHFGIDDARLDELGWA